MGFLMEHTRLMSVARWPYDKDLTEQLAPCPRSIHTNPGISSNNKTMGLLMEHTQTKNIAILQFDSQHKEYIA